ncbi:MAG: hypothetical protein A2Z29_10675 [Chloroflexi bacterium RBG_16_56_11]|nr:MAG: hypothetical protein A2Z29_10675 [Chloroflexi bacterium RBG_16_56_11]
MKRIILRVFRWEYIWLTLIVIVTLSIHFTIITRPSEMVLDEQHYINDARNIISKHETLRAEHPPLGKLIIVGGIKIFGDNPWGWRFFSVFFGTATIVMFYFICRRLNMSRNGAAVATFFLATENMTFIQASVAMLDVYYLTFMMAAFLLYLNRRYINSGISAGLAGLAKLNGLMAFPAIVIHWVFSRQRRSWWFLLFIFFAGLSFFELMILFDFAIVQRFSALNDPFHRIKEMASLSGSLTFETVTHEAASRPWEWLLSYKPMAYWYLPNYTGAISPSVWALTIPSFGYMVFRAIKRSEAGLFGIAWFAGTYLLWIPASIITDRISYPFYFYPTIGAVCLGMGMGIYDLFTLFRNRRSGKLKWTALAIVILVVVAHLASFIILSPLMPIDFNKLFHIGT